MKKIFVGRCHDLGKIDASEDAKRRLLQSAIGEALMDTGVRLSRMAEKERFVPVKVELEVLEQGWDLQVRIRMEDKDGDRDQAPAG